MKKMVKVKLSNIFRENDSTVSTSFWDPQGKKPISAEEFIQTLFGDRYQS